MCRAIIPKDTPSKAPDGDRTLGARGLPQPIRNLAQRAVAPGYQPQEGLENGEVSHVHDPANVPLYIEVAT